RQLRRPAELALDLLDELPDLGGGRLGLLVLNAHQRLLMLAIGEPDFEQAVGEQSDGDHGDKQGHIFAEKSAAPLYARWHRTTIFDAIGARVVHPIASSAWATSDGGFTITAQLLIRPPRALGRGASPARQGRVPWRF